MREGGLDAGHVDEASTWYGVTAGTRVLPQIPPGIHSPCFIRCVVGGIKCVTKAIGGSTSAARTVAWFLHEEYPPNAMPEADFHHLRKPRTAQTLSVSTSPPQASSSEKPAIDGWD